MKNKEHKTYVEYVQRYKNIIEDFDAFLQYSEQPLPKVIWTNLLKIDPILIAELLSKEKIQILKWWDGAFKVQKEYKPGKTVEFLSGQIHAQEEVSMYPVLALDPQPNDLILDMCASPGNKTAGICLKMNDTGLVIANDKKIGRIALLQNTLTRLGFTNCIVTQNDGTHIKTDQKFDRILVDAPCSAEGNIRKTKWSRRDESHTLKFQPLQIQLLKHAISLVKKGGIIIYSTCTFAPEENEYVVNSVLGNNIQIEKIDFPESLFYSSGILKWNDKIFHESLENTCRFYPHQNDTGGFFVAKLRKL